MEVDLERKYYVKNEGLDVVIEEIKQRIKAKTTKHQKLLLEKMEGKSRQRNIKPNAEESRKLWSNICSPNAEHNKSAEWINEVKESVSKRRK